MSFPLLALKQLVVAIASSPSPAPKRGCVLLYLVLYRERISCWTPKGLLGELIDLCCSVAFLVLAASASASLSQVVVESLVQYSFSQQGPPPFAKCLSVSRGLRILMKIYNALMLILDILYGRFSCSVTTFI